MNERGVWSVTLGAGIKVRGEKCTKKNRPREGGRFYFFRS